MKLALPSHQNQEKLALQVLNSHECRYTNPSKKVVNGINQYIKRTMYHDEVSFISENLRWFNIWKQITAHTKKGKFIITSINVVPLSKFNNIHDKNSEKIPIENNFLNLVKNIHKILHFAL